MSTTLRFCRTCQQSFSEVAEGYVCPECGAELVPLDHGSTIAIDVHATKSRPGMDSMADDSPHDEIVGREIANYRMERFLGHGGMARVYLATHLTLHRPCAIKLFRPTRVNRSANPVETFLAEARAAAALVHPNVVTIHTIGSDENLHFIEMEYVAGRSLASQLTDDRVLDAERATRYMVQISSALAAAHDLGMIHRDVKPANVMLTGSDQAKLADFGLAKKLAPKGVSPEQRELLCGTPSYMAPELFAGTPASKQSDVYAMGITYYSLLAGRPPVESRSLTDLMQLHASRAPLDMATLRSEVPAIALDVLERCLSYSPADRFEDAQELLDALSRAYGSLRSLKSLVDDAPFDDGICISGEGDAFEIQVPLANDRAQQVRIEECRDVETGEPIIRMMSVCARATGDYYEQALQLNAAISHGALAITDIAGEPHFVMMRAYPRATCDPEEIYKSVLSIARHSDAIELKLTGDDRF